MPDEQIAESSTAVAEVEAVPELLPIESLNTEQYEEWRKSGKVPLSKEADSTPAQSSEDDADATPASSSGNKQQGKQQPSKTEQRIQELLKDRAELRERLARVEGRQEGAERAASPPAKTPEAPAGPPAKPKSTDFETYAEYEDAKDSWRDAMEDYRLDKALKADRETRKQEAEQEKVATQTQTVAQQYSARIEEFVKTHPDAFDVLRSDKTPIESRVISEFLIDAGDNGVPVHYHLCSTPGEAKRIAELPPIAAVRELMKIEAQVGSKSNGNGAKPPAQRKISAATPPVTELSGANGLPEDEADAALARKDFTAYRDVMNKRDIAKRQGR